jgi:hypothetical protein
MQAYAITSNNVKKLVTRGRPNEWAFIQNHHMLKIIAMRMLYEVVT